MNANIIISIQINDDHQELPALVGNESTGRSQTHWQFSVKELSTGNLINLLLDLESLGFEADS